MPDLDLYVEQSIVIDAPAWRVWEVLTDSALTRQWIGEWRPDLGTMESDWKLDSAVLWRAADGTVAARGEVSTVEPHALLRIGFVENHRETPTREDLTYRLVERDGRTTLTVTEGDFSDTPEHRKDYSRAEENWSRSLPKIKALAEK